MSVRRALIAIAAIFVVATDSATGADETQLAESLRSCAALEDADERLACFDELAAASASVPAPAAAQAANSKPAQPAPAGASPPPITDSVGIGAVKGSGDSRPEWSVTVTRCEEDRRLREMFLFLENGQVWKVINYRGRGLRECRFEAVLTQDVFGYKLEIPSKDRTIRVSRLR